MSEQKKIQRPQIILTKDLPKPNKYAVALDTEFKDRAFNEERAPLNKGFWRKNIFNVSNDVPMDVEIGTGSGMHFAHHVKKNPTRCFVGLELKYKPLIQTMKRTFLTGGKLAAMCRYHAFNLDLLFDDLEINNVFIHFPDPWTTPRKPRNRVFNRNMLMIIYKMQRPGSFLELKTDSREYFLWALDEIKETPYEIEFQTLNLDSVDNDYKRNNFQTGFEEIFVKQGIEINYIKLVKK